MKKAHITPPLKTSRFRWGLFLGAALSTIAASNLVAGVLVAPTVIFMSDKSRTGRMDIQNPTNIPKEVTIRFSYGLPISDTAGNVYITLQDSGVVDPRSAVEWIKAFPRKVVIPPNGTQVVRLVATPPKGLADGEYWARIVVRTQEGETSIPAPAEEGTISTKLNMIMQTAIMVKYRTGNLTSKIELASAEAYRNDTSVVVIVDLSNKGNVSYVGMLSCRLLDMNKKELGRQQTDLAVYRDLKRRMELPLQNVTASGPYQVEVSITTDGRSDIAPEDLIPGNKVTYSMAVE
ncbi:MAG: hypothetical protein AB1644_08210 [Candidatus Zixiibacteriota bacterium]